MKPRDVVAGAVGCDILRLDLVQRAEQVQRLLPDSGGDFGEIVAGGGPQSLEVGSVVPSAMVTSVTDCGRNFHPAAAPGCLSPRCC